MIALGLVAPLFAASLVLDVAGDCPRAAELPLDPAIAADFDARIAVEADDTRLVIEMFDAEDATLRATKTIDGRLSCKARAEAVAVVIEAWSLELSYRGPGKVQAPKPAARELPRPIPRRTVLPASKPADPPSRGRWVAAGAGVAVIAGVLSLNIASPRDSGLDQPTDFVPALLYVAGAALIGAAIFSD